MKADELFGMIGDGYEPVRLTAIARRRYLRLLPKLCGEPGDLFEGAREDMMGTGHVREIWRCSRGRTYVRYEVRLLRPDCTFARPLQLLTLWGTKRELLGYATAFGTGRAEPDDNGDPVEPPALDESNLYGLEPAGDWDPGARTRTIHVARGLRRALFHAVRMCDRRLEGTLRDYGVDEREGVRPLDVAVPRGAWKDMTAALDDEWSRLGERWSESDLRKLCLYLAIQGVAGACRDVALGYDREVWGSEGEKNPKYDFDKMLYWFERGAKAGDAQCQYSTGYLYRNAEKTQHDCDRAFYWFGKAAEQDHVNGLKALAYCLECGNCVPIDRKRAAALKDRAKDLEEARTVKGGEE